MGLKGSDDLPSHSEKQSVPKEGLSFCGILAL